MLIISVTVFSCRVTLAPARDASLIVNVLDIQNSTNTLYSSIISSQNKSFSFYESDYLAIDSKIDSLVSVNKDRKYAQNIYKQAVILQTYFDKYTADHKNRGTLKTSEARVYKDYLQSFIKTILVSELSLK